MIKLFILILTLSLSTLAKVEIINPHIAHVIPGSSITAAFLKLKNTSDESIDLLSVEAKWANSVELHNHVMEKGVMSMRKMDKMTIPANGELILKSKSYHIMIFGLKEELKLDDIKILKLNFSNKKSQEIKFKVIDVYAKGYKHP